MSKPSTEALEPVLTRLYALLAELFLPAGVLMYVSAPHRLLDGRTTAEAIRDRDIDALIRVANSLDALADGAFA